MPRIKRAIHYMALFPCMFLLALNVSCAAATNQPARIAAGQYVTNLTQSGSGIARDVPADSPTVTAPFSTGSEFDIRWLDCPQFLDIDLTKKLTDAVPNITFNSKTVWPQSMPPDYNYTAIMEAGKNPGLGVYALHSAGITGKGVSIAIIDQPLFSGHVEYKDNLALYEEIHTLPNQSAAMHGSAVSSIAVGKTCGVAPGAKLYYWAINPVLVSSREYSEKNIAFADGYAAAVDRMLEVNAMLPETQKIRALSISQGFDDMNDPGVKTFLKAIDRAKKAGIFVITTTTFRYYDFMSRETDFAGLGKADLLGDPDVMSTYTLGSFEQVYAGSFHNQLLVPMDARTTADPSGVKDYAFYSSGGYSWIAPYLAGMYALVAQVKPDITPKDFWSAALATASKLTVSLDRHQYTFNHVINPQGIIDALR